MNIGLWLFGIFIWILSSFAWLYHGLGNKTRPGPKKWSFRWWLQGPELILAAPIFLIVFLWSPFRPRSRR
jgi:hypothetical protein